MQTQPTIEPTGSPVTGFIPEPVRVHHDPVAAPAHVAGARDPRIAAVADIARAASEARLDADRWMNEGGRFASEADGPSK